MVAGGLGVQLAVVVAAVLGLWVGARSLVDSVVRLARRFGVSELTIGLTVVAVGTSTPELVVSVDAALVGTGDIAVGNVVGSNVYNLAVILGTVAALGAIPVERSLVRRDGLALVGATLLGVAALADRSVGALEGGVLLAAFAGYTAYLLHAERGPPSEGDAYPESRVGAAVHRHPFRGQDALLGVVGLVVVLVSGHAMVEAASAVAAGAGVSEWVIGGTIVAAGTSTPEFAVSLLALRRGYVGMSVGNVVGSNVFNVLGVLGVAALLDPIVVGPAALETLAWLVAVTVAMVAALWTGRRLSRVEGALFALSEVVRWALGLLRIVG